MAKQHWATPRLIAHGTVSQITAGGGGDLPDVGGGNSLLINISDRAIKEHIAPVDQQAILGRVMELPIGVRNATGQPQSVRRIGPTAEDFAAAFGVGEDTRRINPVDASGVTLAAIQALTDQVRAQQAEIDQLRAELRKE